MSLKVWICVRRSLSYSGMRSAAQTQLRPSLILAELQLFQNLKNAECCGCLPKSFVETMLRLKRSASIRWRHVPTFRLFYCNDRKQSIAEIRHTKYEKMVASHRKSLDPPYLPPTVWAAKIFTGNACSIRSMFGVIWATGTKTLHHGDRRARIEQIRTHTHRPSSCSWIMFDDDLE